MEWLQDANTNIYSSEEEEEEEKEEEVLFL
jgi:hypothetical protein